MENRGNVINTHACTYTNTCAYTVLIYLCIFHVFINYWQFYDKFIAWLFSAYCMLLILLLYFVLQNLCDKFALKSLVGN